MSIARTLKPETRRYRSTAVIEKRAIDAHVLKLEHAGPSRLNVTGNEAAEIRRKTGMSQSQFARLFCLSVRSVQKWERQERDIPAQTCVLYRLIERAPIEAIEVIQAHGPSLAQTVAPVAVRGKKRVATSSSRTRPQPGPMPPETQRAILDAFESAQSGGLSRRLVSEAVVTAYIQRHKGIPRNPMARAIKKTFSVSGQRCPAWLYDDIRVDPYGLWKDRRLGEW
jgi:DNA-binding transcriptional regulator YiaG